MALRVGALSYFVSAATEKVMATSPSVRDLKRLAGRQFDIVAEAAGGRASYSDVIASSPGPLVAWLDAIQTELSGLREALAESGDARIEGLLEDVDAARAEWDAVQEAPARSRAFEELDDRHVVMDALFGSWGRNPFKSRRQED